MRAAARFLSVCPSLLYSYVERKQIPYYRMVAHSIRFRLSLLARASFLTVSLRCRLQD